MIKLDEFIHVIPEPKPKSELGKLGTIFKREVSVVAYTSFGDLFLRDELTQQIALAFFMPFELVPLDAYSLEDLAELYRDNPDAAEEALQPSRARQLMQKLGPLGPDEIFIPAPYPMWGGDGSIESYSKGNLWVHVEIVTE